MSLLHSEKKTNLAHSQDTSRCRRLNLQLASTGRPCPKIGHLARGIRPSELPKSRLSPPTARRNRLFLLLTEFFHLGETHIDDREDRGVENRSCQCRSATEKDMM